MNVPKVDIKQLLEAGVHLGHKTTVRSGRTSRSQNLKMEPKNEEIYFW